MYQTCIFDLYGTLVDIHTDEEKPELWERLALFYSFYGACYTPDELHAAYKESVLEFTGGAERLRTDTHEAYPEIQIEEVFAALFEKKGVPAGKELVLHAGQFFRILSIDRRDIEGAKKAGLSTLYVRSDISPKEDFPEADHVLTEMDMEKITEILLEKSGSRSSETQEGKR